MMVGKVHVAKFNSICPACDELIRAGAGIRWDTERDGFVHDECHPDQGGVEEQEPRRKTIRQEFTGTIILDDLQDIIDDLNLSEL